MSDYVNPYDLEQKLKNADIALDKANLHPRSCVRDAVREQVKKHHYERKHPEEGLSEEGKEEFWSIFNSLRINGRIG
jgi:hypothetical protein